MTTKNRRPAEPGIFWPRDLEVYLNISPVTVWRMTRDGRLPPRDAYIGGRPIGWRRSTIERALRGETASAA